MQTSLKTLWVAIIMSLIGLGVQAQEDLFLTAFSTKWENSKQYMMEVAERMPDSLYGFRPTEREMTFGEQIQHITGNIEGLSRYLNADLKSDSLPASGKKAIIARMVRAFDRAAAEAAKLPVDRLAERVDFFAGEKNLLQILNLMQDHVTHHRGQLLVYLNLKGIEPPRYTGW